MRRIHLIIGILGVTAFLITGQIMKYHDPRMPLLTPEIRMMYVSRHIYLLAAALVNLAMGLYLQVRPAGWERTLQQLGSLLIVLAVLSQLVAFQAEPAMGLAGRGWRSCSGLIGLFAGMMAHLVASTGPG